ncbi:Pr6Pr family membrane protein [Nocardia seriolae]|uniref:Pr6Pr family membrane protein n=1 Tax=Nocardia seriolae TaxID=37332 RepID=UPI00051A3FEF|nr:Pr6Pr family membrane protein [Nocardia seriolae]MTJ64505.1 F420-dependent oxidoreductase [Nocardia seriolae]MTJ75929.1 F420-dependent oxidoreductase [Nocardia seriolae]MTJ89348.1 F420-dependent oxidoreductase [Nocardia seriolae]MTK33324.1 F420-dependent oxidoreductase [Nocardia seriolae]MTK42428.1 F420-dependent oxidoreductase [Nocardia seriolae]
MDVKWARAWFAVTAACVAVGVIMQLVLAWQNHMPEIAETGELFQKFGGSPLTRALNVFAFFTVQSNLIVGATSLLLAINPNRSSNVFSVFRLIGLVAITVTGIVYHVALGDLFRLDSWALAADQLLHTVVPVMMVVGWVTFGPRGLTSPRVVKLTILFPLAYMIFTVIRGPLTSDWYPYPFADVHALGYARVLINAVWIGLLFVSVAAGAAWIDKRLPTKQATPAVPAQTGP